MQKIGKEACLDKTEIANLSLLRLALKQILLFFSRMIYKTEII